MTAKTRAVLLVLLYAAKFVVVAAATVFLVFVMWRVIYG